MSTIRELRESDYDTVVAAVRRWWSDSRTEEEARELSLLLPRLFAQFFADTSLVAEEAGVLAGFLVGFDAPHDPRECYVHFVGVDPQRRGDGLGRQLYAAFLDRARVAGRTSCRAVTSPGNAGSIAFHRRLGFEVEPGDLDVDGVRVHADHDGPGEHRVCFRLDL